jgi:hypothetical protein
MLARRDSEGARAPLPHERANVHDGRTAVEPGRRLNQHAVLRSVAVHLYELNCSASTRNLALPWSTLPTDRAEASDIGTRIVAYTTTVPSKSSSPDDNRRYGGCV